jgi:site-specific DNA recombinase
MKNAVIYVRTATELQGSSAIDGQIAHCQAIAERHGYNVVRVYTDRAQSGASTERDGLLRLLRDADERAMNAVIVESLDRLSRDQSDLEAIRERLDRNGVTINPI